MDIKEIIEAVARHYDTSVSDILASSRDDKTITARHVAIYLTSSCTTASLLEIAKAFNRTHATVYFAERKVFERMAEDDVFRSEVEQLQRQLESAERPKTAVSTPENCNARWRQIQAFIQEAGIVLDYLHWRVLCKCSGAQPASALFLMTADGDGELTEEMIVAQLEAIARQARAGFVDGPGFPVFASLNRNGMTNDTTLSKMTIAELAGIFSITSYQRDYRWTEDEIIALLNDLAEYAGSRNSDGYCLQSLVLQPVKDSDGRIVEGKYFVVDGQQRLITLYIILRILNYGEAIRWDIEYTTENNRRLCEVLQYPGSSINDHFCLEAFKVTKTWSERNVEAARKVQCLLSSGNVFFLRYLISPEEDGHVVFQRLNAGKTPN